MRLNIWRRGLAQERPLEEWLPVCRDMLNDFFLPDADTSGNDIEQQWQAVSPEGVAAEYGDAVPISYCGMNWRSVWIRNVLASAAGGPHQCCTLMPMRSIPFKVVCLLGMNDGVYPRQLTPLGFDLMSQKPMREDRSRATMTATCFWKR